MIQVTHKKSVKLTGPTSTYQHLPAPASHSITGESGIPYHQLISLFLSAFLLYFTSNAKIYCCLQ